MTSLLYYSRRIALPTFGMLQSLEMRTGHRDRIFDRLTFTSRSSVKRWGRRPVWLLSSLSMATGTACIHTGPRPSVSYWATSDSSLYSPVARFRVTPVLQAGQLRIRLDSGSLSVPGDEALNAPPLMSKLYLTAFLAILDSSGYATVSHGRGQFQERRGWRPIASSDSVLVADELHYGERRPFRPEDLVIRDTAQSPTEPLWLVFRISGNTVLISAPPAPGAPPARRDHPGGVNVYVCGDRDVAGRLDAPRAAALKRAYGLSC
jgi:hypothetical protein